MLLINWYVIMDIVILLECYWSTDMLLWTIFLISQSFKAKTISNHASHSGWCKTPVLWFWLSYQGLFCNNDWLTVHYPLQTCNLWLEVRMDDESRLVGFRATRKPEPLVLSGHRPRSESINLIRVIWTSGRKNSFISMVRVWWREKEERKSRKRPTHNV